MNSAATTPSPISAARGGVPPLARGVPILGSLPAMIQDPLAFAEQARAAYGDVYRLDILAFKVIMLNHPRHAQHVLRDHAANYTKSGPMWDSLRTLLGNGLPVSEGDFWRRQRRMMQPQFHHERLSAMTDLMVQAIDEEMAGWDAMAASGQPVDITVELTRMTMKVLVRTMFGTSIDKAESDAVSAHMTHIFDFMVRGMLLNNLPRWVPRPGWKRYQASIAAVDKVVFRVIERSRGDTRATGSLIQILLDLVDAETGAQMTPSELRDEAMSMFAAGYETTAASLAFTMGYLTQEPGVVRGLHAEVDAALGERTPGFADLRRLSHAMRTMQEAMRLSPPAYWLPRVAVKDDVIDGFAVPAGTMVASVIYTIHRNPAEWTDPARFDPDRFLPERSVGRHSLAWMAFGAGQRQCIARDFSLMEGQLILARIAQRYDIGAVAGPAMRPQFSSTLRPRDPVMVRLARRERAQTSSRGHAHPPAASEAAVEAG